MDFNPGQVGSHSELLDKASRRGSRSSKKIVLIVVGLCIGMVGLGLVVVRQKPSPSQPASVVPASIRESVPFKVYYPEAAKMQAGYTLDQKSFTHSDQAVVYAITYDGGKQVAITVQKKPREADLKTFYRNHIPIRNELQTSLGKAAIAQLNGQSFASLPAKDSWLLITAPLDINQDNLRTLLQSLRE